MKTCAYCGRANADEALNCAGCGTALAEIRDVDIHMAGRPHQSASKSLIDLSQIDGAFEFEYGFSRPDWELIRRQIERSVGPADSEAAWTEAAHQWLEQLKQDLGGAYWVTSSDHFIVLSDAEPGIMANLVRFAERAHDVIRQNLRDVAWQQGGKDAILLFSDEDDYYEYLAYFYSADRIPRSLGVHLTTGFTHIALIYRSEIEATHTIAHELTHGNLPHLPVPLWLNEGVAETLRRMIGGPQPSSEQGAASAYWTVVSGWTPPVMWDELAERHQAFWDEKNIQSFWAGTSFDGTQEAGELSYSLAEVLVHLLSGDHEAFLAFLSRAHYDDAGQTAALECLERNLGDVVAEFLGPGDWRPYRKAIVECWNADQAGGESSSSSAEAS